MTHLTEWYVVYFNGRGYAVDNANMDRIQRAWDSESIEVRFTTIYNTLCVLKMRDYEGYEKCSIESKKLEKEIREWVEQQVNPQTPWKLIQFTQTKEK